MSVEFKEKNICIDGKPTTIFSGEFQYFRTDPGQWRDRLEKLKAMGLNAIGAYFPWNYHSDRPGEADFTAPQRNISRFLGMAQELGLMVTARPGPYICNEWDLGGYPGWLLRVPSGDWRTAHPDHLKWFREWYRAINAVLVPFQQANGGPVILYQVENEHFWGEKGLFERLAGAAAEDGIEVPLVGNHGGSVYETGAMGIADGIDIYTPVYEQWRWRGWFDKLYRSLPENVPMMLLEYQGAVFCTWGEPQEDEERLPSRWIVMQTMLFLAKGANLTNFFVAAGGVNPPGLGSDHSCTNYMADASVSHWGGLGRKFYEMRLLAGAIGSFNEAFSLSKPMDIGWGADNANVECLARRSQEGTFYFAFNNTVRAQEYRILLPGGGALPGQGTLRLEAKSAVLFACDLKLTEQTALSFCTAPIFKLWRNGSTVFIIAYGPDGTPCRAEIQSGGHTQSLDCICSAGVGTAVLHCADCDIRLYAITPGVAERTWFVQGPDGSVPMFSNLALVRPGMGEGGSLRAETEAGVIAEVCAPFSALTVNGIPVCGTPRTDGLTQFRFPVLSPGDVGFAWGRPFYRAERNAWRAVGADDDEGWQPVGPFDGHSDCLIEPGSYEYRLDFDVDGDLPQTIVFTGITGVEAQFFLNGSKLGVFPGARPGAYHPLPCLDVAFQVYDAIRPGRNRLTVSCELIGRHNLGRPIYAGVNRPVVLRSHQQEFPIPVWKENIEQGKPFEMTELQAVPPQALPGFDDSGWQAVGVASPRNLPPDEFSGWHDVRWYRTTVPMPEGMRGKPLFLRLPRVSEAWVYANGSQVGYVNEHLSTVIDLSAFSGSLEISLAIALRYLNWMRPWALLEAPVLFTADRALDGWKLRKGSEGERMGWLTSADCWTEAPPAVTFTRLWYRREVTIRRPEGLIAPVCVELDEGWKSYAGVYWNGVPIGLYADIGPDRRFYVPDGMIQDVNTLVVVVDGYNQPTVCGGVSMGVYERKVPLLIQLKGCR